MQGLFDAFRGCRLGPRSSPVAEPPPTNIPTSAPAPALTSAPTCDEQPDFAAPPPVPVTQPIAASSPTSSSSSSSSPATSAPIRVRRRAIVPVSPNKTPTPTPLSTGPIMAQPCGSTQKVTFQHLPLSAGIDLFQSGAYDSAFGTAARSAKIAAATVITSHGQDVAAQDVSESAAAVATSHDISHRLDSSSTRTIQLSNREKAETFVKALVELHGSVLQFKGAGTPFDLLRISTMAHENVVDHVERLLVRQDALKVLGMCHMVDLGYHYTKTVALASIFRHGLFTRKESAEKGFPGKSYKVLYGDGIYTSDDHKTYRESKYGSTGLLVMRLKGMTIQGHTLVPEATYVNVNQRMVVLRSAAQCAVVLAFDSSTSDAFVVDYHVKVQKLIDLHLNDGTMTLVEKEIRYEAPNSLDDEPVGLVRTSRLNSDDGCSICLCPLSGQPTALITPCGHQFHYACMKEALGFSSRCPLCKNHICEPRGYMPSGTICIRRAPSIACAPYPAGSITIQYVIDDFIQKEYHCLPLWSTKGTTRIAYLPDCAEGQQLLKRLEYAFTRGLTFTVGTSLTSGATNVVVWGSIHHKTSTSGGVHGYPDAGYFVNCNAELDALGVPLADEL